MLVIGSVLTERHKVTLNGKMFIKNLTIPINKRADHILKYVKEIWLPQRVRKGPYSWSFIQQSYHGLVKLLKLTIDCRMNVQIKKILFFLRR